MPIRHRTTFETEGKFKKRECPKELSAKLRDPRCRADGKDYEINKRPQPGPTPTPPGPQPGPGGLTPTVFTGGGGGGGLTPAEIAAITGGSLLGAAGVGYGAYRAMTAMRSYEPVSQEEGIEMGEAEPVQAELAPIEEVSDIPTEEDLLTALGKGGGGEGWGGSETAGMTLAKLKGASPTYVNPEEDPAITGEAEAGEPVDTGAGVGARPITYGNPEADPAITGDEDLAEETLVPKGSGATFTSAPAPTGEAPAQELTLGVDAEQGVGGLASGAVDAGIEGGALTTEIGMETTGLALGPEAIPAVAAMVAVTALASFGPQIVEGIASIWGDHDDWYHTLKHASRFKGDDWDKTSVAMLNQAVGIKDKDQRNKAFDWIKSLNKAQSHGLNIVKWEDEATDTKNITAQKGTKQLAIAIAKYQRNPDAFKGQDPRKLAIEGLSPIMAYGKAGAKLNPKTGFYEPVMQYSQVKGIDQTMKSTAAALLKQTQDNPKDTRNLSLAKMQEVVNKTYMDDGLLPGHDKNVKNPNPYLSEMGNTQSDVDNSVLSTQQGIMKTAGNSQAVQDYVNKGAIIPATGAVAQPTLGSQSNQKPATSSATKLITASSSTTATSSSNATQKPATSTTTSSSS